MPSFLEIVYKFSLRFINKEIEESYNSNKSRSANKLKLIFLILALVGMILYFSVLILDLVFAITGQPKIHFGFTIVSIILLLIAGSIEIYIYYTDNFKIVRGSAISLVSFHFIGNLPITVLEGELMISFRAIPLIVFIACVACVYTRRYLVSGSVLLIGIIDIFVFSATASQLRNGYGYLFLVLASIPTIIYGVFLFYFLESSIRTGFYAYYTTKKKKETTQKLLTIMPVPIVVLKNKQPKFANSDFEKLFSYEGESPKVKSMKIELIRTNLSKIIGENGAFTLLDKIGNSNQNEDLSKYHFTLTNPEGNIISQIQVKNSEIMLGQKTGIALTIVNLSEYDNLRRKIEKKYQSMLIATFAHEIRTPVNGCIGISEEILGLIKDEQIMKKVAQIKNLSFRLIYFLEVLQIFTDIQSNTFVLNVSKASIEDLINRVVRSFKQDIKLKKLKIILDFENLSPEIDIDSPRFELIIFILLHNAIKYTIEGQIKITGKINIISKQVSVIVKDSGIGIPKERLPTLFELNDSSKKLSNQLNPQGMGFALFVAKKLSQEFGGDLYVMSELNIGTQFECTFPILTQEIKLNLKKRGSILVQCPARRVTAELPSPELDLNSARSLNPLKRECVCTKFLVVDDEPMNIIVIQNYLKKIKEDCDIASNGQIAVEKVIERSKKDCCGYYDIIFMDLNMPVMDGEAATTILTEKMSKGQIKNSTIIGVTAAQIESEMKRKKFQEIGFQDVYQKPVSRATFQSIVNKYSRIAECPIQFTFNKS